MSVINLNEARILITNDDGISAEGIKILRAIANEFSNDVWVVAPEHEKSGASHALSFQNELTLKKYEEKTFSVNGTPSDCVAIGISNVLKDKRPDLILSGINSGCNVGEDVTYLKNLVEQGKVSDTVGRLTVHDTTPKGLSPLLSQETIDSITSSYLPIDREQRVNGAWDSGYIDGRVFENFELSMIF